MNLIRDLFFPMLPRRSLSFVSLLLGREILWLGTMGRVGFFLLKVSTTLL